MARKQGSTKQKFEIETKYKVKIKKFVKPFSIFWFFVALNLFIQLGIFGYETFKIRMFVSGIIIFVFYLVYGSYPYWIKRRRIIKEL